METLRIDSSKPFSIPDIARALSKSWRVEISETNNLIVHGDKSRVYLHGGEFAEEGIYRLLVDYSEVQLVKKLLEEIADDPAVTVDNDFGTVLCGNEFVARCKSEKGWEWRS